MSFKFGRSRHSTFLNNFVMVFFVSICIMLANAPSVYAAPKFSAIAIDARTGKILFAKNADSLRYPASLTKMMTLYLVFQDLKSGRIKMQTPLRVSRYAASRPPSKLGFKPGRTIRVKDAILALVTKSANDVATTIAENLGGTEAGFARRMTKTARRIGMTRTTFRNASGLPSRSQMTTARDMATLGLRLQRDFPRYYRFFKTRRFVFRGRRYGNHNRLLGRVRGIDGIKTGYTRASGFNLTTSARRGKKRIVAVVMGGRTGGSRNRYMSALVKKIFRTKRLVSSTRIALTAGSPPGYKKYRRTRLAKALPPIKSSGKTPTLPRKKPVIKTTKRKIVVNKKDQDRIQQQKTLALTSSTFKTASIIDDDAPADIVEDHGSSQVLKGSKANMLKSRRVKVKRVVKIKEKKLVEKPAVSKAEQKHARSWNIQIGAFPSKQGATGRLKKAVSKAKLNLRGKTGFTIEVKKGERKFYRARFAGFNKRTAKRACRALSRKGVSCFALAPRS